jgi:hypothetical protein
MRGWGIEKKYICFALTIVSENISSRDTTYSTVRAVCYIEDYGGFKASKVLITARSLNMVIPK